MGYPLATHGYVLVSCTSYPALNDIQENKNIADSLALTVSVFLQDLVP